METAVLVAIITGLCSVIGQWLIARQNKAKTDTERAVHDAIVSETLQRLERKVDEHNGYAAKFAEHCERLARIEQVLEDRK